MSNCVLAFEVFWALVMQVETAQLNVTLWETCELPVLQSLCSFLSND